MLINASSPATNQAQLSFAEFFAGIGLVRKGLEKAGWQCMFANEIDAVKSNIYIQNFGKNNLKIDDIANVTANDLENVTLITASFPCQDLSLAGNRMGLTGKRSSSFFKFNQILNELAADKRFPQLILIENVIGLLTSNEGNDVRKIILSLNELGYSCDILMIDAVHFLPQSRPRLFIIGAKFPVFRKTNLNDFCIFQHPCRPKSVQKVINNNSDLSWNFLDLSPLPVNHIANLVGLLELNSKHDWFSEKELARELSYIRQRSQERLQKAQQIAHSTGKTVYLTAYRRMRKGLVCLETRDDGIAGCLRTASGGSSRQVLIVVSPEKIQMRYLSAREYGRLQGVEDEFWIPENQNIGRNAFGDAVAVPVIAWLGMELKRYLNLNSQSGIFLNDVTKIAVVNV